MGKKSRTQYTSKGERRNVVNGRGTSWTPMQELNHKLKAWMKGKKVFLTIPNPIKSETAKPFIRVPADHIWRKFEPFRMKQTND